MKYLDFANHVQGDSTPEILITLIDLSGSMEEKDWKPSRKAGAAEANRQLIKIKTQNYPQDKVGIIGFGTDAILLHEPVGVVNGAESLCKVLEKLPDMGWTNFKAALKLAEACLFGKSAPARNNTGSKVDSGFLSWLLYDQPIRPSKYIKESSSNGSCIKRVILLTDGDYNYDGSPLRIACRLKDAGVVIDCIGIGGSPEDVEEEKLKEIASQNTDGSARYCFIADQQNLVRKYEELAHHIRIV